jgi:hypothetical protein
MAPTFAAPSTPSTWWTFEGKMDGFGGRFFAHSGLTVHATVHQTAVIFGLPEQVVV